MLEPILGWLYPERCNLCGGRGGPWCTPCRTALPAVGRACRCCGVAITGGERCGACQRAPPPLAATVAPFRYAPPLDGLVHRFKYGGRLELARALGLLLAEHIAQRRAPLPELLVPVPLHRGRLRERGFNQSLELCRVLSRQLDIPYRSGGVLRNRATPSQAGLARRARAANVRGAFTVAAGVGATHVAVVDDVITSGHTVGALARALRNAGARRIEAWALARA